MLKKLQAKQYVTYFFTLFIIFILYHSIVWIFYSSKIFGRTDHLYIGDLGRTSYQLESLYPRKLEYTLEKKHIGEQDWHHQNIDVLTIGDSFSNADTGGLNPYYQDFLATKYNLNILNLKRDSKTIKMFDFIVYLYNSGILKKLHPKAIIIESVERFVYDRFAKKINFQYNDFNISSLNSIAEKTKEHDSFIPSLLLINTANYKLPYYTFMYHFKYNAHKSIPRLKLSKTVFSNLEYGKKLLITYEDIQGIKNDSDKVIQINDNFNILARMLKTLNIKLFFMPAPDRYDLYYNFIKNSPYQKNQFFDLIRPLEKEYIFIDTKAILQKAINSNILDIYYPDDAHWTFKASNLIAKNKVFYENFK